MGVELTSRFGAVGIGGLQVLREEDGVAFCRGWRGSAEGTRNGVLAMLPASEQPTPATLDRLAHEYSLKDELDGTWALRPLELVRDRGQTVLVLEDPGGELLGSLLGTPMEVGRFLSIAIGLAAALGKVHQRGLIHKDIKPANILVNDGEEIRLTGFGIASRLPRERQPPDPPEVIAGTLAYMAPEQTGRMNRSIDSRSDLYSLGVTLYEMLTGNLPFKASDPMEWVHCHIARQAGAPDARANGIPAALSSIAMKLLAKTAEERYQTAPGVEADLRRCLMEWQSLGRIDPFPLGARDASDRLLISERLYGREPEIATLLAAFDRVVAQGTPELVLVSGYSGVGKSSVVNELHKVLAPPRGLFAAGKFDQYKRDIPYATLAQAFQTLIRQILVKSEAEVEQWRRALAEALGVHGQLMVELVPELEFLIGKQPAVPDLPPQEEQNRFKLVFRRFLGAFATPEHPLALFLDDLQWLDAATLELIEQFVTHAEVRRLLLVGAYRDNEVGPAHPLLRALETIKKANGRVGEIVLAPLGPDDVGRLVASALHCDLERARPLAQLVHEKTGGNPFFANQVVTELAEEGVVAFDPSAPGWQWDLDRIRAKNYTGNVVDLMVVKLNRLPAETEAALRQLACVGARAAFDLLGIVCQTSQEDLHNSLWEAVRSGLLLRAEDSYAFQHDRIQEAAYSLIPVDARAKAHLEIGRLLLGHTPADRREEIIFDIVNQFNRGAQLITSENERDQLAELNLAAGKRAKASTAYASALRYFIAGEAPLSDNPWERRPDLIFQLEVRRAECEFLTGELGIAAERLEMLRSRAENTVELAMATSLGIDVYMTLGQYDRAVAICLDYLRYVGIDWPLHPTEEQVRSEYDQIWSKLGGRAIEEILDFPVMTDPTSIATLAVLSKAGPPTFVVDPNLAAMLNFRAVSLSVEYGNNDGSCLNYVWLGMLAGPRFGDEKDAFRFGQLGYELVEKCGSKSTDAGTYNLFATTIMPWTKRISDCCEVMRQSIEVANGMGDLIFAAYSRLSLNTLLFAAGVPLAEVQSEAEYGLDLVRKAKFDLVIDAINPQVGLIRTLRGSTATFGSLDHAEFDEVRFERHLASDPTMAQTGVWYWIRKLQARFFAGDFASAIEASLRARPLLSTSPFFEVAEYDFYGALARAACCISATTGQNSEHFDALKEHHRQLEIRAERCPENLEDRAALAGAERARLEGRTLDAERLYEQAIRSARANGFVHNEALACETAARFYSARGFEDIAEMYLARARDGYLRWGADGKARQLEARYPQLAVADLRGGTRAATSPDQQLDVAAVVKASQALSSEMLLPRLIERLMTIALQNAGAERGLLILPHESDYRVEAEARADGEQIVLHYGASMGKVAPETIIRYVMRTRESVILYDAAKPNLFSEDPYFALRRQRSILCLPLIRQGALVGLLYLENALASHVFTSDRARLLELVGSQAAISLENTRLYGDLQEREAKVRRLVDSNIIGIFIYSLDRRILEANDAFLDMVGYSRDDVISGRLNFGRLTPPEWAEADERRLSELTSTGTWKPSEKEFFRKDGSRVPVLLGSAIFSELQRQGIGFVIDLTERKRAEAELAHANRVATMGQLAASIAHEVNQPIATTLTSAETAARWLSHLPPNLEKTKQAIDRIIGNSKRAADILSRIRDFSTKAPARKGDLEVNEAIVEITRLTRAATSENGVSVRMQLSEGLPRILGDRVQLQQVILNLIMNAIEAMSEVGEGSRELVISTRVESGGVLVAVSDSGPGLPPTNLARIFEAFYTTKANGLGMGLSICRSIVEAHGGQLWVTPNEPHGAVFRVMLPSVTK
jgi:PAS domain S-box-containing protein